MKSAIAVELEVDEQIKKIMIRYVIQENPFPITTRNDMGVKLYIEVKKKEPGFGMYSLCCNDSSGHFCDHILLI